MTFVDAAIEVLRREGKPLTARRLTELAIQGNLLSVVGRDPELTMQQRLDEALLRSGAHPELVRLKPDLFGLRSYPPPPSAGQSATSPVEAAEAPRKGRRRRRRGRRENGAGEGESLTSESEEGDASSEGDEGAEPGAGPTSVESLEETVTEPLAGQQEQGAAPFVSAPAETTMEPSRPSAPVAEAAGSSGGTEEEASAVAEVAGSPGGVEEEAPLVSSVAGPPGGEEAKRRRRRRGGRGRRRPEGASPDEMNGEEEGPPEPAGSQQEAAVVASAGAPQQVVEAAAMAPSAAPATELAEETLELETEIDHDTGPVLAPAFGAEDVTRTAEDRTVRPEILGSRDERHRRDRHKDRRERRKRPDKTDGSREPVEGRPALHGGQPTAERPPAAHGQPTVERPRGAAERAPSADSKRETGRQRALEPGGPKGAGRREGFEGRPGAASAARADERPEQSRAHLGAALAELLRSAGRPLHARQLAELAVERHWLDGKMPPADQVRLVRLALLGEQREHEAEGRRPRLRVLGGGQFAPCEHKLESELAHLERELAERAARLHEETVQALRRRLSRLAPAAFEGVGRALCERLELAGLTLVRRGEGVSYWGGARARGVGTVRTLVALRAGESEIGRRAVGELRAGLAAKGYDEGLLLAAGRPNAEALTELGHSGQITLYDGAALARLMCRQGLGVKRRLVPVDHLDLEFFAELNDG